MNILITSSRPIFYAGLSSILASTFTGYKIDFAGSLAELVLKAKQTLYDICILDIDLNEFYTLDIIKSIKSQFSHFKLIIISNVLSDAYEYQCMRIGADAYLTDQSAAAQIIYVCTQVLIKGKYISPNLISKYTQNIAHQDLDVQKQLSARELDVIALMIKGDGILEIANKLNLSRSTVSTYKKRIFEKLKVDNLPALIAIWNSHSKK